MKLKKFMEHLNTLVKEYPGALELDVITAKDDEGNGFNQIHYRPCVAKFDGQYIDNSKEAAKNPNVVLLN